MAANNLQWAFVQGFEAHYEDFSIISVPFISTFPFGYKAFYFKGGDFFYNNQTNFKALSFINLPFLKEWIIKSKLKSELRKWCQSDNKKKCIVIYALFAHFMQIVTELKVEFPNLKICQIIPDLPEYMGVNSIYKKLGLQKKAINTINSCLPKFDCFVFLSSAMNDRLNTNNKPWVRIEGIFDHTPGKERYTKELPKVILYSGALSAKYGLKNLLNAFSAIQSSQIQLWLCGDGDFKLEIEERARNDQRIKFLGLLTFEEVKELQKKATVLVNPRTAEGEYTLYSFPSKTMEYLASGTPTIMYRLPGIPEEYYEFAYIPANESIECLTQLLLDVCNTPQKQLEIFGKIASKYIIINKSPKSQVGKISEMFKNL